MLEGIYLLFAPLAIVIGFVLLVKLGIKKYTDPAAEKAFKEQQEVQANKENVRQRINKLISEGKTKVFDKNGNSLVMYALRYQLFEEAEKLMDLGISPATVNKTGENALHLVATQNKPDLLRRALKSVKHPDLPDEKNRTPLIAAAIGNAPDCVEILTNAGADINAQEKDFGYTSLMIALKNGYVEVADILIQKGSDLNLKNHAGQTAVEVGRDAFSRVITTKIRGQQLQDLVLVMEAKRDGRTYSPIRSSHREDDQPNPTGETMGDDDA